MTNDENATVDRGGKESSFEDAFSQLRETVRQLEAGGLTLEESMRLFDQGMHLAKVCNELLTATELKITRLQRSFGEQMAMVGDELPPPENLEQEEGGP